MKKPIKTTNDLGWGKVFSQFLLVLAGGLIGVLGNQFFFERNKKLESELVLKREFLKDQLPLYTRIINFTYFFQESHFDSITNKQTRTIHYDPVGIIYDRDTTNFSDTVQYKYPSFIEDTIYRKEFYKDIEIIQSNKDKLDTSVWVCFVNLIAFLRNHPFPANTSRNEILNTDWVDKNIYDEWLRLNYYLYDAAILFVNSKKKNGF